MVSSKHSARQEFQTRHIYFLSFIKKKTNEIYTRYTLTGCLESQTRFQSKTWDGNGSGSQVHSFINDYIVKPR